MTNTQENSTGRPLADSDWLEAHHMAKLPERTAFAHRLAELNPTRIVDLGCATGLWLDLLNQVLPDDCEFIGIDSDEQSLAAAKTRAATWSRKTTFLHLDIERQVDEIPAADITLAFNIFPYIQNLSDFLVKLASRPDHGTLAVRQYDGDSIRFGPMETEQRQQMETSLRLSIEGSSRFSHYDMDRTFTALKASAFKEQAYNFELFARTSPFLDDFIPYYRNMLEWTANHLSEIDGKKLWDWLDDPAISQRYFFEVDLVALLS